MSDEKPTTISELSALIEEMILSSKPLKVEQVGDERWVFNLAGTRLPSKDELTKAVVRAKELETRSKESVDPIERLLNSYMKLIGTQPDEDKAELSAIHNTARRAWLNQKEVKEANNE